MTSFFSADGGPIWIKFRRLVQNDMSTAVMWSESKPDVEFRYGRRLGEFNGLSSQSHLPHCRVMPPGEFSVMIPKLRVTLQGAATGRVYRHIIPVTYHIVGCCHRASLTAYHTRTTYHIAGCCHLVNSLSRFHSHMQVQSPDEINVVIVPHCRV